VRDAVDLTSQRRPAYRSSVTRCRRVPHVHAPGCGAWVGGAGRSQEVSSSAVRRHRAIWPISRVTPLTYRKSFQSEQAYVPAEQPPPPQGARIPAAHAHPRRALHPVRASPQGPQESRRLSPRGSTGPCLRPCFRHRIASPAEMTCAVSRAAGAGAAATPSWCTCSSAPETPRAARPRSGSWSAEQSATPWSVTGCSVGSATSSVTVWQGCPRGARSWFAPSRRPPVRRTRNSVPTSTVVSIGPSMTDGLTGRSAGEGV